MMMPGMCLMMLILLAAAEVYVHYVTGDVPDDSSPAAEAYVHDTTGVA